MNIGYIYVNYHGCVFSCGDGPMSVFWENDTNNISLPSGRFVKVFKTPIELLQSLGSLVLKERHAFDIIFNRSVYDKLQGYALQIEFDGTTEFCYGTSTSTSYAKVSNLSLTGRKFEMHPSDLPWWEDWFKDFLKTRKVSLESILERKGKLKSVEEEVDQINYLLIGM